MKLIRYRLMTEVNRGTEEIPDIVQSFNACMVRCSDENFETSLAAAQREAYNGELTIEDVPDPVIEPTTEERVDALEEQVAQADEIAIALYESQVTQDEAIIELYEMIGG